MDHQRRDPTGRLMGVLEAIKLVVSLLPLFQTIISWFVKTPAEKRSALIVDLHEAFKKAKESGGDTSLIEEMIKKGRQ